MGARQSSCGKPGRMDEAGGGGGRGRKPRQRASVPPIALATLDRTQTKAPHLTHPSPLSRIRASRRSYRYRRVCGCRAGAAPAAKTADRESTWAVRSTPHSRLAALLQVPTRLRVRCRSGASREDGRATSDERPRSLHRSIRAWRHSYGSRHGAGAVAAANRPDRLRLRPGRPRRSAPNRRKAIYAAESRGWWGRAG